MAHNYHRFIAELKEIDERRVGELAWMEWIKTGFYPPAQKRPLWFWAD